MTPLDLCLCKDKFAAGFHIRAGTRVRTPVFVTSPPPHVIVRDTVPSARHNKSCHACHRSRSYTSLVLCHRCNYSFCQCCARRLEEQLGGIIFLGGTCVNGKLRGLHYDVVVYVRVMVPWFLILRLDMLRAPAGCPCCKKKCPCGKRHDRQGTPAGPSTLPIRDESDRLRVDKIAEIPCGRANCRMKGYCAPCSFQGCSAQRYRCHNRRVSTTGGVCCNSYCQVHSKEMNMKSRKRKKHE